MRAMASEIVGHLTVYLTFELLAISGGIHWFIVANNMERAFISWHDPVMNIPYNA